jgi:hypothetical protein
VWLLPIVIRSTLISPRKIQLLEAFRKDRLTDSGGGILIYIRDTLLGRRRLDLEVTEVERELTFILTMEILRSSHLELFDNGPGLG